MEAMPLWFWRLNDEDAERMGDPLGQAELAARDLSDAAGSSILGEDAIGHLAAMRGSLAALRLSLEDARRRALAPDASPAKGREE